MNIRNHEIIHEISRGAITTVYKARHLNLNRTVILKVLNPQWLREQDLLKRFKREARISAHLRHPNIVNVYDFHIGSDLVYISLEYVEGGTLEQYIRENRSPEIPRIISVLRDTLRALDYAHERGIIHRDIKPGNILLDENFTARLTDFGLASFQDMPGVTVQGQSMGTPAYMPPELIRGEQAGVQSDLYSLGLTLYEMLTGDNPFRKENTAATLQAVLSEEAPDISGPRPDAPRWITDMTRQLMERDPRKRPPGTAVLLQRLESTGDQAPVRPPAKKRIFRWLLTPVALIIAVLFYRLLAPGDGTPLPPVSLPASDTLSQAGDSIHAPVVVENSQPDKTDSRPARGKPADSPPPRSDDAPAGQPPSLPPQQATGSLYVSCTPWAKILLDGDSVDVTPLKQAIELSAGTHRLELVNPNYKSESFTLNIVAGRRDTLNVRLKPDFAYLMIKATPWARVYINNRYKEDTPLEQALIVPAGRNIIELVNPVLGTIIDTLSVRAGERLEKHYRFTR